VLEIGETEDSEEEKLVDLDSDEVDCTIIEDDIDLEELMKQKVSNIQSIYIYIYIRE
jgi:serine/threonine-protein kinase PRP4